MSAIVHHRHMRPFHSNTVYYNCVMTVCCALSCNAQCIILWHCKFLAHRWCMRVQWFIRPPVLKAFENVNVFIAIVNGCKCRWWLLELMLTPYRQEGKGWAGISVKGTRILRDRTARWESITWDRTRDEGHVLGTCMPCHCSATANSSMLLDDNWVRRCGSCWWYNKSIPCSHTSNACGLDRRWTA